jgi:hypothetical protein
MKYKVYDTCKELAITSDYGIDVYLKIHPALLNGETVELDFSGVRIFTCAFFNYAIAQLLKDINADELNRLLIVTNLVGHGHNTLINVINNAKNFYGHNNKN